MKSVFIIEDDISVREELFILLNNAGYNTKVLTTFDNVVQDILDFKPDLVLLDINIPGLNGEVVLLNLRKRSDVPVIMVTSRNTESDEVLSMSYGADDYITKPYNPNVLLLRIGAVLKRTSTSNLPNYRDLDINMQKGIISNGKDEIILTKNEMIIFNYLLINQSRIVSRDELMTELWDNDEYINDNALSVNISRLRNKLKEIGIENPIETRKGIGYILT